MWVAAIVISVIFGVCACIIVFKHISYVKLCRNLQLLPGPNPSRQRKVAIIGGGPSGLCVAKNCIDEGLLPVIFEKNDDFGGVWGKKLYKSFRTNSPKSNTFLSEFYHDDHVDLFPRAEDMLKYLKRFASNFTLGQLIRTHTRVTGLQQTGALWEVTWIDAKVGASIVAKDLFDFVVVCTGQAHDPWIPEIPGLESFPGISIHSSEYNDSAIFADKKVLIVGLGVASGSDISQELSYVADQVFLSHQKPVICLPRLAFGNPLSTIEPWLGWYFPWVRKIILMAIIFGSYIRSGSPFRQSLRSGLKDVVKIKDAQFVTDSGDLVTRCAMGSIKPRDAIESIAGKTVFFKDGSSICVDVIIWATGYSRDFSWNSSCKFENGDFLDLKQAKLWEYAFLTEGPYNIAFALQQHPSGSHWPVISVQSEFIAKILSGSLALPKHETLRAESNTIQLHQSRDFVNQEDEVLRYNIRLGRRNPTLLELLCFCFWKPVVVARFLSSSIKGHRTTLDQFENK